MFTIFWNDPVVGPNCFCHVSKIKIIYWKVGVFVQPKKFGLFWWFQLFFLVFLLKSKSNERIIWFWFIFINPKRGSYQISQCGSKVTVVNINTSIQKLLILMSLFIFTDMQIVLFFWLFTFSLIVKWKTNQKKIVKKKSGFLDSGLGSWSDEQVLNKCSWNCGC